MNSMVVAWNDCRDNIRGPALSVADQDYCINYAWNLTWKNNAPGAPCTKPANCPQPGGPPWADFPLGSCRIDKTP